MPKPFRLLRRLAVVVVILGLAALNVATLTWSVAFEAVSGVIERVTDLPTVHQRHERMASGLRADNGRLRKTNKRQARELAGLRSSGAKLERDLGDERARSRRLGNRLERVRLGRTVADAHLGRMTRELERERTALLAARERMARMVQGVGRTTGLVMARASGRIVRNVGGLVPENVPFVGIAISLGLFAKELSDACESAREMAALRRMAGLDGDHAGTVSTICGNRVPSLGELSAMALGMELDKEDLYDLCIEDLPTFEEDPRAWTRCAHILDGP